MIKDSKINPVSIMTNHIQATSNSGLTPISPTRTNRLRTALRRIAASAALLLGLALPAVATDYVFVYDNGYLALNNSGNVVYTTTFSRSCIWTCLNSNNNPDDLSTNSSRYLYTYVGDTQYWLVGSGTNGDAITASTTQPSRAWRMPTGTYIAWNTGNNYQVYLDGSTWKNARNNQGLNTSTRPSACAITSNDEAATITVPTINPSSAELDYNRSQIFTASATTTPAYTTYTYDDGSSHTFYYYDSTMSGSAPSPTSNGITYSWTLTGSANTYLSPNSGSGSSITITHSTQASSDVSSTLSVTASANGKTETSTSNATVKAAAPKVNPESISAASPVTVYVGSTGAATYSFTPSVAYDNVTGTSSNSNVFTVGTVSDHTAVINPVAVGTATLTLTAHKINGESCHTHFPIPTDR